MDLPEEVQNLLDHCENYAAEMLMETGEIFPFGALTDRKGRTHHREVEVDLKQVPSNGEIMDHLWEYFESETKEYNAKGFAIAYEVSLQIDENMSTDAVAIDIRFKNLDEFPMFYLPFKQNKEDDKVSFREMFAVKREAPEE